MAKAKRSPPAHLDSFTIIQQYTGMALTCRKLLNRHRVAGLLGMSLSRFKQMADKGLFPAPDVYLVRTPRWADVTVEAYLKRQQPPL